MALSFPKRGAVLGEHINGRTQKHGDEKHPACDFNVIKIMLDDEELGEIMREKLAHKAFYNTRGKNEEPLFKCVDAVSLTDVYEKCQVTLYVGLDEEPVKFTGCKVKAIVLRFTPGGLTAMACQVQVEADKEQFGELYQHQGSNISVSMRLGKVDEGKKPQPELPLEHSSGGAADDNDGDHVPGPLDDRPAA